MTEYLRGGKDLEIPECQDLEGQLKITEARIGSLRPRDASWSCRVSQRSCRGGV